MALEFAEALMAKNCDLSDRMTTFLSDCGRGVVKKSQVRLIFTFVFDIINERGLTALDSTDIILCDYPMRRLTNMPHLHLHQLRECILGQLTISTEGRRVANPTDSFKVMLTRIFPPQPPARDAQDGPPIQEVAPLQSDIKWIMHQNLSNILIGYVSDVPVEFNEILTLLNRYISRNRARLLHPMNLAVACIRLDPLYTIFRVSFMHHSQLRGYLRDHVDPVSVGQ